MNLDNKLKQFQVVVYGNLEKYSDTISKSRCRIFYKYRNRNGAYITDEFAEQLIGTLPYAPVKGIYDEFNEDYSDHGTERTLGRIYGIVPAEPNFAWEKHLDDDGVEREYACADVLLYTALYEEAKDIPGKAQSMELYADSIEGDWLTIDGQKSFVYTKGSFLGLQVLGDEVEPCFEGASFYNLDYKQLFEKFSEIYQANLDISKSNKGGKNTMYNFKLSDDAKYRKLFELLNPNCNEEHNWETNYMITDVYDNYAVTYNFDDSCYERVYYSKDDTNDTVTISEKKKCYIVDVTEDEKNALATIQALNNGNFEKVDENFELVSKHEEKVSEFENKIVELENEKATLESEKNDFSDKFSNAENTINELNEELENYKEYKLQAETEKKESILTKYSVKLQEDKIKEYRENLDNYTVQELDKELAFELVNSDPSVFSLETQTEDIIPSGNEVNKTDIELVLDKYEN